MWRSKEIIDVGATPYWYYVPFVGDIDQSLQMLRQREFRAGRYNPIIEFIDFGDPDVCNVHPGTQHKTIEEAIRAAGADGTRSILDIRQVSAEPAYHATAPIPGNISQSLFGTTTPSRAQVDASIALLFRYIERGQSRYLVIFENGQPSEIWFAGYSFD
jgi:hypothetical protein